MPGTTADRDTRRDERSSRGSGRRPGRSAFEPRCYSARVVVGPGDRLPAHGRHNLARRRAYVGRCANVGGRAIRDRHGAQQPGPQRDLQGQGAHLLGARRNPSDEHCERDQHHLIGRRSADVQPGGTRRRWRQRARRLGGQDPNRGPAGRPDDRRDAAEAAGAGEPHARDHPLPSALQCPRRPPAAAARPDRQRVDCLSLDPVAEPPTAIRGAQFRRDLGHVGESKGDGNPGK